MKLDPKMYLDGLRLTLEAWRNDEATKRGGSHHGLPRIPRKALLDALQMIIEHAKKEELVRVVATTTELRQWRDEHGYQYENLRDIGYRWLAYLPATNTHHRTRTRLRKVFPNRWPTTFFGAQVVAADAEDGVEVRAHLTAGSRANQTRVITDLPVRPVLLATPPPPDHDPVERGLLQVLYSYYAQRKLSDASWVVELARHRRIRLDEIRARTLRVGMALIERAVDRHYGRPVIPPEMTDDEIETAQQWYRWAVVRWQADAAHTITTEAEGRDNLARAASRSSDPFHPDELLALWKREARLRERAATLHPWFVDRVSPSAEEHEATHATIRDYILAIAPMLEKALLELVDAGVIEDGEAWMDREYDRIADVEAAAIAEATRRGDPHPWVQFAIRRLARPRLRGLVEEEARRTLNRSTPPSASLEFVRAVMQHYTQMLERPKLRGDTESFLEHELRFYGALHRLIEQTIEAAG